MKTPLPCSGVGEAAQLLHRRFAQSAQVGDGGVQLGPLLVQFDKLAVGEVERLWDYPGLGTPSDAAAVNFVKSLTGANGTIKVAFGTEGGLFDRDLGISTAVCGPGFMDQGHKPDEFVSRDQLARCDQMLARLVDRLEKDDL